MKKCSKCHQIYPDDDLNFCLSDGASLIFIQDSSEETLIRSSPIISHQTQSARQGVNPVFAYTTIALLALIIGGAIVFYWVKSDANSLSTNANLTLRQENSVTKRTTPALPDTSVIENEIKTAINGWTQTLVDRDFDSHMRYYADSLAFYYKKKNADFTHVRNRNLELFKKYSTFQISNSNFKIEVYPTGEQATAVFDSAYDFKGNNAFHSGVGQAEFRWEKINGEWKITSEKTLRTYRDNKK